MGESCNETLCTSCIHRDVCIIKVDYLKIFEMLPKHDDNFSLKVGCKHYFPTKQFYKTMNDLINCENVDGLINYETTTGNPLRSKIDI